MADLTKYRKDFPMLQKQMHGKPLIYLDSAATAQKPQKVIDAISSFYKDYYGTVHRAIYDLSVRSTHEYEDVRQKVKTLLNAAKVEEIIFTRGTTDSINIVADSFGRAFVNKGDEVIISESEHHSNIVPWQMMCEARGAVLRVIPINDCSELILDEYAKLLNDKTRIVAVSHIANSTGTIHPIKQIIEMAHKYGAKVLIDGAQSVPHMTVDVQNLDADFYVFSGHKFYGPTGIGILYGKEALPKTTYNTLPLKFEAGTPSIAEVIGLGAAIDYIQKIGLEKIHACEQELLNHATNKLKAVKGLRIIGTAAEKGAIVSFVVEGVHPLDIGTMLDLRGVAIRTGHQCAQPTMQRLGVSATCRASFGFYNSLEEVDTFVVALQDVLSLFR
jgi:cysteine desulfurase/selenocysteine lyase